MHRVAEEPNGSSASEQLLQASQRYEFAIAESLLRQSTSASSASKELLLLRDGWRRTAVHYAATRKDGGATLLRLVARFGNSCLLEPDSAQVLPLQTAMLIQSTETVAQLVLLIDRDMWDHADADGNTPVHSVAKNRYHAAILFQLVDLLGVDCLLRRNGRQRTGLHYVAICQSGDAVDRIASLVADADRWSAADEEGNTPLHYVARRGQIPQSFLRVLDVAGGVALGATNRGKRSPLHFAAERQPGDVVVELARSTDPREWRRGDEDGDTPAHCVVQNETIQVEQVFDVIDALAAGAFDFAIENDFRQNCLQARGWKPQQLRCILQRAAELKATQPQSNVSGAFAQMLTNSQGLHAVHAFAGRYRLSEIVKSLAELSDRTESQLLQLTVAKGNFKDATSLHFACEAGHEENIQFLIGRGLVPSAETHLRQSCIDFAFDKGKIANVLTAAAGSGQSVLNMLRLVDASKRALKLPERSGAQGLLESFTDAPVKAFTKRKAEHLQDDSSSRTQSMRAKIQEKSSGDAHFAEILHRAVELDSPLIVRSLVSLDMLDFQKSGDSLADALRLEKLQIIPDLLLIRQFDLIPTCIELLLQLHPMVAQQSGKHEQLVELQAKVVNVAVNALDELFINADCKQRELLFKYLDGELSSDQPQGAEGPIFEHLVASSDINGGKKVEMSVVQMIEALDCDDLFATECLHQLARNQWSHPKAPAASCDRTLCCWHPSPRAKITSNSVFLVVFLVYFAWFIIDFKQTFASVAPVLILLAYALSYSSQEMNDFWRRRRRQQIFWSSVSVRVPLYFKNVTNVFDCLSLLFMWIGVVWHLAIGSADAASSYACQMMLTTSFLLWGFRSVAVLSYFERIGPVISMLRNLLIQDLLPFLALLLVIFYSFGVFFFNLLFPVVTAATADTDSTDYGGKVLKQVFLLPAFMLFGFFERADFAVAGNGTEQQIGQTAHPSGQSWFYTVLLFVFLLTVNIVMVNLLIALFNLTVSRMAGKAKGIWRKKYFEMLREYESMSIVPPPLSFLCQAYSLGVSLRCCRPCGRVAAHSDGFKWWHSEQSYPAEYVEFLQYQASQFRRVRPLLSRRVTSNKGDFEQLRASGDNSLAAMQREIEARVDGADRRQMEQTEAIRDELKAVRSWLQAECCQKLEDRLLSVERRSKKQRKEMRQLNEKLDQLLVNFRKGARPV